MCRGYHFLRDQAERLVDYERESESSSCDCVPACNHSLYSSAESREFLLKALPGLVFSYCPTGNHPATKGTNIGDYIPRTSSMQTLASDAYHWHWRFRRNAFDLSPNVMIKHQVTDDKNTNLIKASEKRRQFSCLRCRMATCGCVTHGY